MPATDARIDAYIAKSAEFARPVPWHPANPKARAATPFSIRKRAPFTGHILSELLLADVGRKPHTRFGVRDPESVPPLPHAATARPREVGCTALTGSPAR